MKNATTKPKRTQLAWDRSLWAVEMRSKSCRPEGMFITDSWHAVTPKKYLGEPTRPLLFWTRRQARAWCAAKTIDYKRHSPDWKFKPVRVREILQPKSSDHPREK
jgi:hypothetical protein